MPQIDGFELIRHIRTEHQGSALPIIALTAKALPQDREDCLAAGANDYLSKPVDFDILMDTTLKWIVRK